MLRKHLPDMEAVVEESSIYEQSAISHVSPTRWGSDKDKVSGRAESINSDKEVFMYKIEGEGASVSSEDEL